VRSRMSPRRFDRGVGIPGHYAHLCPRPGGIRLIPEFVGRFPVSAPLDALTRWGSCTFFVMLMIHSCNSGTRGSRWTARLERTRYAASYRARGHRPRHGARGLEQALWKVLEPLLYNLEPGSPVYLGQTDEKRHSPVPSKGEGIYLPHRLTTGSGPRL